ncbi:hypothetical protein CAOG_00361 [Capsaspora owczarzaki ATCC 30864]|uniref:Matrin-type domain-containing protein n=1 Tax=Capsaspora owczarzaki (strain ATCC 30864) TaxID=595528 RepID=A0A0D2U0K2_CAPO3|nr:hypothetical protein CAOG_00361 [Capsaspora owczarzaki ATCC 30864]KJE88771.1 hypothetical protein CAOG_000361 [Capsaspora owczarzaki ATCC 30864]|eukprot:XP_004365232.1 hypothetical protein CAOG_00361 [Capsaspora owczarzaki ATCC 30864]
MNDNKFYGLTEYWVSNARKFCEYCRVWFADNKASIQIHERGKTHQENVQKHIDDVKKRGGLQRKADEKLKEQMAAIERAAAEAAQRDLAANPHLKKDSTVKKSAKSIAAAAAATAGSSNNSTSGGASAPAPSKPPSAPKLGASANAGFAAAASAADKAAAGLKHSDAAATATPQASTADSATAEAPATTYAAEGGVELTEQQMADYYNYYYYGFYGQYQTAEQSGEGAEQATTDPASVPSESTDSTSVTNDKGGALTSSAPQVDATTESTTAGDQPATEAAAPAVVEKFSPYGAWQRVERPPEPVPVVKSESEKGDAPEPDGSNGTVKARRVGHFSTQFAAESDEEDEHKITFGERTTQSVEDATGVAATSGDKVVFKKRRAPAGAEAAARKRPATETR